MNKHLHIISFNVPYPPDYGGVIDVFYRMEALHNAGVKIYLHCFDYGRGKKDELEPLCEEVSYYKRSRSLTNQFSQLPFIVKSRANKKLLTDLLKDDYPILFEGLHTCYFLEHPALKNRLKIVRSHNIEHNYYKGLASKSTNVFERFYFKIEAEKLKHFEKHYAFADRIAAISQNDFTYLNEKYGKTFLMLPSHPNEQVLCNEGRGNYILYHGNLSVKENIEAVLFIIEKIARWMEYRFVLAGKNPSALILSKAMQTGNIEVIANPLAHEMQELISNAHINLLPTFQSTGFKLKLLNALFNGRFCVGTPQLVAGTGLDSLCVTAANSGEMILKIKELMQQPFTGEMIEKRKVLLENYSNSAVVQNLLSFIEYAQTSLFS